LASVEQTSRLIILVEDNVGDARLVREALDNSAIPCELVVITNGERAIQFIEDIDTGSGLGPQLAIVDLNLPKQPGAEVVKRMRASAKCKDVPVVVLTSSNNQIDRENAKRIGVSAYIVKSGRLSEILELGSVFRDLLGLSNDMEK
jgi:CheY-like chemotaxis protein